MAVQFQFDFEKSAEALMYLARKNIPALGVYKVCKLLFLADKYHLVKYGRPITGDRYVALEYGPIPSQILDLLNVLIKGETESPRTETLAEGLELDRQYKNPRFNGRRDPNLEILSKSECGALDRTIKTYGDKTFEELKAITHEMPAYRKAWDEKPKHAQAGDMNFEDFFEEDSEAIGGAFEEMLENDSIRRAFPDR